MRRLSVKFRVVLGLVGLTVCIAMLAFYAGFIPDKTAIVRENRKALAETIAVHSTAMVLTNEFQRLAADFKLMAARNGDLISLGLRRADGRSLIASAGHDRPSARRSPREIRSPLRAAISLKSAARRWNSFVSTMAVLWTAMVSASALRFSRTIAVLSGMKPA